MKPVFVRKICRFLLVTIISSWLLFFPAYVHYYNLIQVDSFRNSHVENPVLSDHLASLEKKWNVLSCFDRSLTVSETFFLLSLTPSQVVSPVEKFSPLRC